MTKKIEKIHIIDAPTENVLTDNDFKLHPNGPVLKAKVEWLNKIDEETNQMQNKLAHMIRFGKTSSNWGRRYN